MASYNVNNRVLIEAWAHGKHGGVGAARHLSYQGGKLASYQTVIANRIQPLACLITSEKYSTTTSKHLHMVRNALPRDVMQIEVPKPDPVYFYEHEYNAATIREQVGLTAVKARRKLVNVDLVLKVIALVGHHNLYVAHYIDVGAMGIPLMNIPPGIDEMLKHALEYQEKMVKMANKVMADPPRNQDGGLIGRFAEATSEEGSWKPEVMVHGQWSHNALVFATEKEASENAYDLFMRWTACTDSRAVASKDKVNASYHDRHLRTW